jgi:hypothetical protein
VTEAPALPKRLVVIRLKQGAKVTKSIGYDISISFEIPIMLRIRSNNSSNSKLVIKKEACLLNRLFIRILHQNGLPHFGSV